jgi:hypothetical protein
VRPAATLSSRSDRVQACRKEARPARRTSRIHFADDVVDVRNRDRHQRERPVPGLWEVLRGTDATIDPRLLGTSGRDSVVARDRTELFESPSEARLEEAASSVDVHMPERAGAA